MSDLKERIYTIIGQPQLAGLATITEDGKPWVRYVITLASEDMTLRCATFIGARKVKQIQKNPEVHLTCGITNPTMMAPYLQIQGRAKLTTDKAVRHSFWTDMLAEIFDGPDDPQYGILEIKPYRIECCTPGSHKPEIWVCD